MTTTVLVHGAWSTGAVWDEVRGHLDGDVHAPTMPGCGPDGDPAVGLVDVVDALVAELATLDEVVLVGHSWSSLVTWMAAARVDVVSTLLLVGAFPTVEGQSLLDTFDDDHRAAEIAAIEQHDGWWQPPTPDELAADPSLAPRTARRLAAELRPHPGRTVTDPVVAPVELGDVTVERLEDPDRGLDPGHWPMVTAPGALAAWIARRGVSTGA